jgi:hypothetical protein
MCFADLNRRTRFSCNPYTNCAHSLEAHFFAHQDDSCAYTILSTLHSPTSPSWKSDSCTLHIRMTGTRVLKPLRKPCVCVCVCSLGSLCLHIRTAVAGFIHYKETKRRSSLHTPCAVRRVYVCHITSGLNPVALKSLNELHAHTSCYEMQNQAP